MVTAFSDKCHLGIWARQSNQNVKRLLIRNDKLAPSDFAFTKTGFPGESLL